MINSYLNMKPFIFLFLIFSGILSVFAQTGTKLELNLKTGETFFVENNIVSVTEQEIMNEKQIIKKNEFSSYLFLVLDKTSNNYYIQIIYKRLRTEIETQNQIDIIDTDSINDSSALGEFYSSLINKSFYLDITSNGKILTIDSLNSLFNLDSIEGLDENTKIMLSKQFGEEAISNMPFFTQFSKNIIQEKESWFFQDTTRFNIFNIYNTKQTLQEITKETYLIKKTSDIYTDKNENLNINNIFINYKMKGNSVGSLVLFKNSCMKKESVSKQYVSGIAGMKYSENSENSYTWPIKITNTITVKAHKIEK